jgi:serine/threonine-protein kinase
MNNHGQRVVKLLDFGIAKLMQPENAEAGLTVVGTRLGTSYTMAPEQIRGDGVDPRTDIYALGVVLYHLLTGQYPFRAETMTDIERQHLESPPPRPSHAARVPPALDGVVLRAMDKNPDRRFPTVKAFCQALEEAAGPKSAIVETPARAAAIYVEVRMSESADADSDEILDDSSAVLDAAEQSFRAAGLLLPLQTGNAIIGAKVLSADTARSRQESDEMLAIATALAGDLASRPTAHTDIHVNVAFHVDAAAVKDSAEAPGGKEIVGGEIISIGNWAPRDNVDGVHVTAPGVDG